jgi:hypothetical protein
VRKGGVEYVGQGELISMALLNDWPPLRSESQACERRRIGRGVARWGAMSTDKTSTVPVFVSSGWPRGRCNAFKQLSIRL